MAATAATLSHADRAERALARANDTTAQVAALDQELAAVAAQLRVLDAQVAGAAAIEEKTAALVAATHAALTRSQAVASVAEGSASAAQAEADVKADALRVAAAEQELSTAQQCAQKIAEASAKCRIELERNRSALRRKRTDLDELATALQAHAEEAHRSAALEALAGV
jgi:hypothetical protein